MYKATTEAATTKAHTAKGLVAAATKAATAQELVAATHSHVRVNKSVVTDVVS